MGADVNIKIIEGVYEAFGRGDVAAIVDVVTDDVDWAAESSGKIAPWHGVHRGKDGVAAFFEELGSTMEVEDFTPTSFAANETDVLTVVRFVTKVRSNGRRVAMDLHHVFRFRDGKIAYYRGTEDTAQVAAAFKA